ncbi:hypothetical protein acsn021_39420 [Anaerocolumna cellulosilytica]|uniref:Uncharacterized protein n=1 Tax=Anaerocolumna cellulosilytica TaxID=433286 RepID=A0A6S6QYT2_9FIRM|nr:hypothetical protein [Anaerocolumna cellulosilytica]MBB5196344.1 hypothetical protein [Anaerocolumna cellulosilytica]BCJ96373.1 hypothetical protein acsn021_39420 [Anaerocolumna cellulosilytica]
MRITTVTSKSADKDTKKKYELERDLKSCMKCKFFWGNSHGCSRKQCYKEKRQPVAENDQKKKECEGCAYRQSERYCFPCMKKLLERK